MTQSGDETIIRERRGVRAMLLRQSISWAGALLALIGLGGLGNAVVQPINQLTRPGGEVLVNGPGPTSVEFDTPDLPGWLQLLSEIHHVVPGLAICLGAWMLRKVLLSIGAGEPFEPRNPRRLRLLALAVFVGTLVAPWATYWSARVVLGYAGADPLSAYLPLELWGPLGLGDLGVALVILAAAEAFQQGRRLADDADGLV